MCLLKLEELNISLNYHVKSLLLLKLPTITYKWVLPQRYTRRIEYIFSIFHASINHFYVYIELHLQKSTWLWIPIVWRVWPQAHLVAWWAAEYKVKWSILLWGNVASQLHLISPGCPQPNSALIVQKRGLKHHSSIHPSDHMQNHQADSPLYVWPNVWSADLHLFMKIWSYMTSNVLTETRCH